VAETVLPFLEAILKDLARTVHEPHGI